MKVFKSLLISLFLAYPFLSTAKVIVSCNKNNRISNITGLCLPNSRGAYTSVSENWHNFIFGLGDSFSDAWEDAEKACLSMITLIDSNDLFQVKHENQEMICSLNECEILDFPDYITDKDIKPLNCHCLNPDPCFVVDSGSFPDKTNYTDLFNAGLNYCSNKAKRLNVTLTVYCSFNPTQLERAINPTQP